MTVVPELSSAVNSAPLHDLYEYNVQEGQIHSAEAHRQKKQKNNRVLQRLAGDSV